MHGSPSNCVSENLLMPNGETGEGSVGESSTNNDETFGAELDGPLIASGEMDCPYCRKPYRQPRLLMCLHTFCEDCIVAMLEGRSEEKHSALDEELESTAICTTQTPPGVVRCPVCKQDSQIGNDLRFVQSLVPDFVTTNLQDANALEKMLLLCESCKSKEKAVARCVDCANVLCPNCVQAHQFMRCFDNHKVLSFEEIKKSGEDFLIHKPIFCPTHVTEHVRLFCNTCRQPVCNECLLTNHKFADHLYSKSAPETDTMCRDQLQKLLSKGKGKVSRCDGESHEMESKLQELQDSVEETRNNVEYVFEKYQDILTKRKEQTLTDLNQLHHELESKIMRTQQQIANTSEKIRDALGFTERLMKHGNTMEILCTMRIVEEQMLQVIHSVPSAQFSVRINFLSNDKQFEDALNKNTGYFHADLEQRAPQQSFSSSYTNGAVDSYLLTPNKNQNNVSNFGNFEQNIEQLAKLGPPSYPPPHAASVYSSPYSAMNGSISPTNSYNLKENGSAYMNGMQHHHHPIYNAVMNGTHSGTMISSSNSVSIKDSYLPSTNLTVSTSRNVSPLDSVNGITPTLSMVSLNSLGGNGLNNWNQMGRPAYARVSPPSDVSSSGSSGILHGLPPNMFSSQAACGPNSMTGLNPPIRQAQMNHVTIHNRIGTLGPMQGQFNSPHGFCLSPDEDIVVADTNNHRIQIFNKNGDYKGEFGVAGKEEGQLWYPRKVAMLRNSGKFIVCDRGNERSRMQLFSRNGHFSKKIAIRYIDIVAGLAIDQEGRVVAVDSVSPTVFCIDEMGELVHWFDCSNQMKEPSDIAVYQNEYFICDFKGHCVCVFSDQGSYLRKIGCEGVTNFPNGIDISDLGDILVGDSHGNRFHVAVFKKTGEIQSEFECPQVKVSRCCGLRITSEGYIITIAKNNHHVLILNTLYIS